MAEKLVVKTGSDNTVKAYEVLQANAGDFMTIREVAESLGVTSPKVTGGLVSLAKKEVLLRGEKEAEAPGGGTKIYKAFAINPDFEVEFDFQAKGTSKISDNAVRLLEFLKKNPEEKLTHAELAEELGWQTIQVVGAATALDRRGLVEKPDVEISMPDGTTKILKVVVLTDEGKDYTF